MSEKAADAAMKAMDDLITALNAYEDASGARPRDIGRWVGSELRRLGDSCPKLVHRSGAMVSLEELGDG